jgi:hypothetical protein
MRGMDGRITRETASPLWYLREIEVQLTNACR